MKAIYKIFPVLFLFFVGCDGLFRTKTGVTAKFVLEMGIGSSVENIEKILQDRLRESGFYGPDIKIESQGEQLEVTLDNYDSVKISRKELRALLAAPGELEFWETYDNKEFIPFLVKADSCISVICVWGKIQAGISDKVKDTSSVTNMLLSSSEFNTEKQISQHPLFFLLVPFIDGGGRAVPGPVIGRALLKDTATVMSYLGREEVKNILPQDAVFGWSPIAGSDSLVSLLALKSSGGKAAMHGQFVSDAKAAHRKETDRPYIMLYMTGDKAEAWSKLTNDNIGKSIAIVFDKHVFSYPTVQGRIEGGVSQITGDFTDEQVNAMVATLKGGVLSASLKIRSEAIVKN